jgi:hypothetical protein
MNQFKPSADLQETLRAVRQSVRELFEELRLKEDRTDISGKDRLERVPALAKRNFANLASTSSHLATKEAWRLVDFLEGAESSRLTIHAREGLRLVELDHKLAILRSTALWREAAAQLREALGVRLGDAPAPAEAAPGSDELPQPVPASAPLGAGPAIPPAVREGRRRRRLAAAALSALLIVVAGILGWPRPAKNVHYACLALEDASPKERALHFSIDPRSKVPRQPFSSDAQTRIFTIGDAGGGSVKSTWTTSQFSYAEHTTRKGPGGGRSDFRLRVGGWGDTYLSLLQVPIPTNHLVQKAVIRLRVLGDTGDSRPTTMTLRVIAERWQVGAGTNDRLWWSDCPVSSAIRNHLPRPGPRYSAYDIDITDLYNLWALGGLDDYGIILEPEEIGSWGPGRPHYSSFNTFYSTRASDEANRPQLILTY